VYECVPELHDKASILVGLRATIESGRLGELECNFILLEDSSKPKAFDPPQRGEPLS